MKTLTKEQAAENSLIATVFELKHRFGKSGFDSIKFHRMTSPFYEGEKWAVRRNGSCMNKEGLFEYMPLPSGRDDVFYDNFRFDTLDEALDTFEKHNQ